MKILEYVKSLLPFFPRSKLQEDLAITNTSLVSMVIPAAQNAARDFTFAFKSKEAKDLQSVYRSFVQGVKGNNFLQDISSRVTHLKSITQALEAQVVAGFDEKVVSTSMSVRKANVVRLVGVIGFINNYTLALLNAISHFEAIAAGCPMSYVSDVTPGELIRLKKYIIDYAKFMEGLGKIKNIEGVLEQLPDVLVESEELFSGPGQELDPFNIFGTSHFKGSPIYHAAMWHAERQHKQHKKMQMQVQTLNKRILATKRAMEGKQSPELESQLQRDTAVVATLSETIRKYEEALA